MVTDADEYGSREVLLLAQLLHINGLGTRDKIAESNMRLINQIISDFVNHKVMKLQNKQVNLYKKSQLLDLYDNLLVKYKVTNTVELANTAFFSRIDALEGAIDEYKLQFKQILQE